MELRQLLTWPNLCCPSSGGLSNASNVVGDEGVALPAGASADAVKAGRGL